MLEFETMFNFSKIMFIVVGVLVTSIFVFVIAMIFNPKLKGKFMSKQFEAMRHMTDYSKDDIEHISTTLGNVAVNAKKNIIDNNEETLKNMATKQASINRDAVVSTVESIKEGLSDKKMFCKHCGAMIDEDSKFCKKCGKEQ